MRSPVTHLLRRSLILLTILFVADRLIGAGLERMFYRQNHGDDAVSLYTLESTKEDLLIFGSSRASHHYNTRLLEKELGVPVYNCGRDEMSLTYAAAVVPVVYKRYTPKCIILEVLPIELATRGKELNERHTASVLMPFANKYPSLWETVAYTGKDEVYKAAISKIYPYNSLIGAFFQNTYTNLGHKTDRGYEPLYKTIDTAIYAKSIWKPFNEAKEVDDDLAARLSSLLDTAAAHGTKVYVIISPFYFYQDLSDNECLHTLRNITADHGAQFLDFSADPRFLRQPGLFNDDVHLNDKGAEVYTRIIADTLRRSGFVPAVRADKSGDARF